MVAIQRITDELTLRAVDGEADKKRFAAFHATHNGRVEGAACTCLLNHHPDMASDNFWLVESESTHEIVSTTCLIPWTLRFSGLDLRAAQLEMVLTHPAYRGRGLVRTQMAHFNRAVTAANFDLSIIWGIPYYYRQYGYGYAIDGATFEALPVWKIPDGFIGDDLAIRLRPARIADISWMTSLYDSATDGRNLSVQRSSDYWRYLLEDAHHPINIVVRADTGDEMGYAVILRSETSITILEHVLPDAMTCLALLQMLKTRAREQIRIAWPVDMPLAALARHLGSETIAGGQWLLRIVNVARFLEKMAPLFEQRIAGSTWRNLSTELTINLYGEAFLLRFRQGKLNLVDSLGFVDSSMGADGGHVCIPPDAFLRLLFGYRTLDELLDDWPDTMIKAEAHSLLATLFPRLQPFLYLPFHDLEASH